MADGVITGTELAVAITLSIAGTAVLAGFVASAAIAASPSGTAILAVSGVGASGSLPCWQPG